MKAIISAVITVVIALGTLGLTGCSANRDMLIGSEKVIEQSGDTPKWVNRIPKEDKEYYYFRGFKTSALSLEDGLTDARSNATRQIVEMIASEGLVDYKKARVEHGLARTREDVGSVTSDGLKILSRAVASGVKELESYTEKVERVTVDGINYAYNVYTLVRYPKTEFQRSVALYQQQRNSELRTESNGEANEVLEDLDNALPTGK